VLGEGRRMGVWVLYTSQVAHMQQKFQPQQNVPKWMKGWWKWSCNFDGHTCPPSPPHTHIWILEPFLYYNTYCSYIYLVVK